MINKQFDAIDKNDIENLANNEVPEGKTIDYKTKLHGNSDDDKKEFLADVSSFANASGGDIIYGISEKSGIPTAINGLNGIDNDAEIRRLDSIIQASISPRIIGLQIKAIDGFTNGSIILIRIPKSWNSPHMVTFKNTSRFYARNSAGKYQLDVDEIRSAFIGSESVAQRLREFRSDRIAKIIANETPVKLQGTAKMVLHIVPLSSFTSSININLSLIESKKVKLQNIDSSDRSDQRYNFDGFVTYGFSQKSIYQAYTQIFRNGLIEAVQSFKFKDVMPFCDLNNKLIYSLDYEDILIKALEGYLNLQKMLDLNPPILVMLSLLGVKGYKMFIQGRDNDIDPGKKIDRDNLVVPEIVVDDFDSQSSDILRPVFDTIWQACGWNGSQNYYENGIWRRSR